MISLVCSVFTIGLCKSGCPGVCFSCNECSVSAVLNASIVPVAPASIFECDVNVGVSVDVDRYPGPACGGTGNCFQTPGSLIFIDAQIVWYESSLGAVASSSIVSVGFDDQERIKSYVFPSHVACPSGVFGALGNPSSVTLTPVVEIQDTMGPVLPGPPVRSFSLAPVNFTCGVVSPIPSCPPGEVFNPVTQQCECFGSPSCGSGNYCDPVILGCSPLPAPCDPVSNPCPSGYVCNPLTQTCDLATSKAGTIGLCLIGFYIGYVSVRALGKR